MFRRKHEEMPRVHLVTHWPLTAQMNVWVTCRAGSTSHTLLGDHTSKSPRTKHSSLISGHTGRSGEGQVLRVQSHMVFPGFSDTWSSVRKALLSFLSNSLLGFKRLQGWLSQSLTPSTHKKPRVGADSSQVGAPVASAEDPGLSLSTHEV